MKKEYYIKNTIDSISKHGRGIVGVFDNEFDESQYTYFYSLGNSSYKNQPRKYPNWRPFEYICFHPTEVAAEIIHKVAAKVNRSKHNLSLGSEEITRVPGLLTDFHVEGWYLPPEQIVGLRPLRGLREKAVRERYMPHHGWEEFSPYIRGNTLVQVLLSDENNLLVGEEGCNQCFLDWTPDFLWA